MNIISITTPQNTELEYELGSVGDRIGGALIDEIIKLAYIIIIMSTSVLGSPRMFSKMYVFFLVLLALPVVFYNLTSELLLNGQSVGKKVMGLRVMSFTGEQASFSQYLNRWLFRPVDFMLTGYMLAIIMVAATERKQRLGDLVAGTVLIKTTQKTKVHDTLFDLTDASSYAVTYPEVGNLRDRDIQLLKEIILSARKNNNYQLAASAQEKIEGILQIKSRQENPLQFLQTVLTDYNHITSKS